MSECKKCGKCCGSLLPLTEKDQKRVEYIIKAHRIKPQRLRYDYLTCPFLTSSNKCIIYNHRPTICKIFKCEHSKVMPPEESEQMKGAIPTNMWNFFI